MLIELKNAGKQFQRDWIFRDLSLKIEQGDKIGITGPNGSGKSTLLKVISGQTSLSKGNRFYYNNIGDQIDEENLYSKVSFAAPYIELIEEFSLQEIINFCNKFRPLYNGVSLNEVAVLSGLPLNNKVIKSFSSGMKQRVKLLLAICFESELILIDEPSTNLDEEAGNWYNVVLKSFLGDRTLIIASNDLNDFKLTDSLIDIRNYKS